MKRSLMYKISGILIVLFWLVAIEELVRRTNVVQEGTDVTHIEKKVLAENYSETWKAIFLKERKVGYTVTRVKKIKNTFEVNENIFLTINLMGSMQDIWISTKAEVDETFLLNSFDFYFPPGLSRLKYQAW